MGLGHCNAYMHHTAFQTLTFDSVLSMTNNNSLIIIFAICYRLAYT